MQSITPIQVSVQKSGMPTNPPSGHSPHTEKLHTQKTEPLADRLVRYTNYGTGAAGSVASALAAPYQISKNAPSVIQTTQKMASLFQQFAQGNKLLGPGARVLATGTAKLAKGTEVVSKISLGVMQTPVLGKLTSPAVSETMTRKVLPVVNAVGATLAITDNSLRFVRAREKGNTTGQVVAGVQVGLNLVSGVAAFLPGKAQWVAAGAGLAGLGLEMAHQLGGLGK